MSLMDGAEAADDASDREQSLERVEMRPNATAPGSVAKRTRTVDGEEGKKRLFETVLLVA